MHDGSAVRHAVSFAAARRAPVRFAGRPIGHWGFGLRTWLAMMLALYVAFWLQLEGASSAATCVGILALPTRGQAFQKAFYRFIGTVVGVVASFVIAGLLNETRELFLVAVAAWIALCVFAASLLDGQRAYGAVLSGYTVAIVAVADIDSPLDTFSSGINRGAAITVGIIATMVVSDLFAAPNVLSGLIGRIEATHRKVRAFVLDTVESGRADPVATTRLMGEITAFHPDITALPTESIGGSRRAAAAARAVSALVREVRAAGSLVTTFPVTGDHGPTWRSRLAEAFDGNRERAEAIARHCDLAIDADDATPARMIAARGARGILNHDREATESLDDMATGRGSRHGPGLPIYRSRRAAARNALRVFAAFLIVAATFALTSWPDTSFAVVQVGALLGISATNPNPRGFALGALIAMPAAAAIAGITEFLVLDGVDQFPLLAIAMLPPVVAGCLLIATGNPLLFGIGFLNVVFFPVLLSPTNPQSYNPQSYLVESFLAVTGVILLAILLATVLPTSAARKRRWLLGSIARDVRDAAAGRRRARRADAEASYRAADRLGQIAALAFADDADRVATLSLATRLAEITFAARWVGYTLKAVDRDMADRARAALAALDPVRLRAVAGALLGGGHATDPAAGRWAAANLARTAALIERSPEDVARIRAGAAP